jgi:hypothetical protein
MQPPHAAKLPHQIEIHGDPIVDDYFWLCDYLGVRVAAFEIIRAGCYEYLKDIALECTFLLTVFDRLPPVRYKGRMSNL